MLEMLRNGSLKKIYLILPGPCVCHAFPTCFPHYIPMQGTCKCRANAMHVPSVCHANFSTRVSYTDKIKWTQSSRHLADGFALQSCRTFLSAAADKIVLQLCCIVSIRSDLAGRNVQHAVVQLFVLSQRAAARLL